MATTTPTRPARAQRASATVNALGSAPQEATGRRGFPDSGEPNHLDMDLSVREKIEFLLSIVKVARVALDGNPEVAERELARCRAELTAFSEFARHRAGPGGQLLMGVLREVEIHLRQAEALLEERLVST